MRQAQRKGDIVLHAVVPVEAHDVHAHLRERNQERTGDAGATGRWDAVDWPRMSQFRFSVRAFLLTAAASAAAGAAAPEVRRLGPPEAPAKAICERCADGDYLIDNGRFEAVIGASHRPDESFYGFRTADALGSIVFVRAEGAGVRGDIMLGTPYLRLGNTTRHVVYDDVSVTEEHGRVQVVANGEWSDETVGRVRFEGRYDIAGSSGRIDVALTVRNAGEQRIENLIWSIFFDPHQIYDFSPADVAAHRALTFRGYPRARHLVGWIDPTPRAAADSDFDWGWDGGMILPDPLPVTLGPGEAETRRYALVIADTPDKALGETWRVLDVPSVPVALGFSSDSDDYFELVVRDAASSALFYRAFLDRPGPVTLELPPGRYTAAAHFFPGTAECTFEAKRGTTGCRLQDPPRARVSVRVVDSAGRPVPGKVTFRGVDGTPTPYFRPHNPARDDGYWESAKNSVFPVHSALEVTVPAGAYRVSASRGPEYSVDERGIDVEAGGSASLTFTIDRVIDRPDLLSMDPHLHTLESDGAVTVSEKIRAIVAEGVDVAIATDHNLPVDYRPALERLGLEGELMVIAGAEVTVPERLDYNTYPMAVRPGEQNHGAINALSTDLGALFEASRRRDANVILQVNHPRSWQFDYFNWHGLDPQGAAYANEGFDLSFDVLEVVNGAVYDSDNNRAVRRDWFNLLRRGYVFPLVGSSDSHEIDRDEPGYSRTWIYHGEKDRGDVTIEKLMQRVRAGHAFASNGPILDLLVAGRYGPGDTFTPSGERVPVAIDVWSASWIEADSVRLYVNGVAQTVPVRTVADAPARHLRAQLQLQPERDVFIVAEVTGTGDLAPVVQSRIGADDEVRVTPYALTNPVFVDVDGNGRFDPPLPEEILIRDR